MFLFCRSRHNKTAKTGSTSSVILNGGGSGSGGSAGGSDETDSSSFDSDIKNIMAANPLGPTLPVLQSTVASHAAAAAAARQQQRNLHYKAAAAQTAATNSNLAPNPAHASAHSSAAAVAAYNLHSQGSTPSDSQTDSTNVTPVYWSASQLLSKLDHNTSGLPSVSAQHYHGNPYVNSSADGLYGLSSGHYVPNGPHSLQQLSPAGLMPHHTVPNQPPSLAALNNNMSGSYHSYQTADPAVWQGSYHLHHASAGISDYQVHPEIPEEYTITVTDHHGEMTENQRQQESPKSQKPRNITQV